MDNVRTRFAPSPTGQLHIGGVRTALFAFLIARHANGQFILRIEDTDTKRQVEGAEEHITACLKALDLNYDEGPDIGGPYGPYKQSQRLEIYKSWAQKLVDTGRAYTDPYTADELNSLRDHARDSKKPFLFRNHRPDNLTGWDKSKPLRFKSEPKGYSWNDLVLGDLTSADNSIDDFILIKSDGYPTYNFAHIIDDYEMKISHIIRGQEYLPSVPNYLNLYEALEIDHPKFVTVPHILNESGNAKLSKRDGSKDVLEYLKQGYLKEAFISYVASLGWNDGSTQEIFTLNELIDKFRIERIQKSGAKLDQNRLNWINGHQIRATDIDILYALSKDYWPKEANSYDDTYRKRVLALLQERLKFLSEISELSIFFFKDLEINPSLIKDSNKLNTYSNDELINLLEVSLTELSKIEFKVLDIQNCLNQLLGSISQKPAVLFSLIRIATTQAPASPPLAESLEVLGKEKSLKRITDELEYLKSHKL